jgi:hypothetical protein
MNRAGTCHQILAIRDRIYPISERNFPNTFHLKDKISTRSGILDVPRRARLIAGRTYLVRILLNLCVLDPSAFFTQQSRNRPAYRHVALLNRRGHPVWTQTDFSYAGIATQQFRPHQNNMFTANENSRRPPGARMQNGKLGSRVPSTLYNRLLTLSCRPWSPTK